MNVLRSVKNPSRFPAGGTENRPGRKPGKTRGRELRTGPLRSPPYVPYGTRQFPYSHIPAEPAGPYLSVRSGWLTRAAGSGNSRSAEASRFFPIFPRESSPAEGFRLRHFVRYHAPGYPRCQVTAGCASCSGIRPPGDERILSLRVSAPPACGKSRAVSGFWPVLAGSPFSAGLMKILPVRPEACLRLPGMPDCKFPVSRGQRQSFHHHDAHVPGAQKSLFPGYRKEASLVIYGRMATYASRDPLPRRASRR